MSSYPALPADHLSNFAMVFETKRANYREQHVVLGRLVYSRSLYNSQENTNWKLAVGDNTGALMNTVVRHVATRQSRGAVMNVSPFLVAVSASDIEQIMSGNRPGALLAAAGRLVRDKRAK